MNIAEKLLLRGIITLYIAFIVVHYLFYALMVWSIYWLDWPLLLRAGYLIGDVVMGAFFIYGWSKERVKADDFYKRKNK